MKFTLKDFTIFYVTLIEMCVWPNGTYGIFPAVASYTIEASFEKKRVKFVKIELQMFYPFKNGNDSRAQFL